MATKICFTGDFKVTCEYGRSGIAWKSGRHQGIDLVGITNKKVYSICNGVVERAGYDKGGFGNYVRIKEDSTENRIYLAHLDKIYVRIGQRVSYTTVVGLMGGTGNATGPHTHVEIRRFNNGVAISKLNPASYMGIPNKVGTYNTKNYQIKVNNDNKKIYRLKSATNLRNEPTIKSSEKTTYLGNTSLYILEKNVAISDGYTWDKVKIIANNKIGYMINSNYIN